MRYLWVLVVSAFVFGYIAQYLFVSTSPWDKEKLIADFGRDEVVSQDQAIVFLDDAIELGLVSKYLNFINLGLLLLFSSLSVGCVIVFVHLVIDKLFFKKFYEEPNLKQALRRAALANLFIVLLILLRLFALLDIYTGLIFLAIVIFVEYSLSKE